MNGVVRKMAQLINRYVSLEKEIQKLLYQLCRPYCENCASRCCREEMCRESIESPFLAMLVEEQGGRYDTLNGWLGPSGCRLAYGRPLVCYEFFCNDILKCPSFRDKKITEVVHGFITIGSRAHGSKHLVCIESLEIISPAKIDKMIGKIGSVRGELANLKR